MIENPDEAPAYCAVCGRPIATGPVCTNCGTDSIHITDRNAIAAVAYQLLAEHIENTEDLIEWEDIGMVDEATFDTIIERVAEVGQSMRDAARSIYPTIDQLMRQITD